MQQKCYHIHSLEIQRRRRKGGKGRGMREEGEERDLKFSYFSPSLFSGSAEKTLNFSLLFQIIHSLS